MKLTINPQFTHLEPFLQTIPAYTPESGDIIRDNRNFIYRAEHNGTQMVVKRFKRPTLVNCIIYTFIRKNKARRSFEYSARLNSMGIETPAPIAYIEIKKNGFFHTGYFISSFVPDGIMSELVERNDTEKNEILVSLADFTVKMHQKGILHNDFNLTNVFYNRRGGRYNFAVTDINRARFRTATFRRCADEIKRMGLSITELVFFAEEYARIRKWNAELFCGAVLMKRGFNLHSKLKKLLKSAVALFTARQPLTQH